MDFKNSLEEDRYSIDHICTNLERVSANLSSYPKRDKADVFKTLEECRTVLCSIALEPKNLEILMSDSKTNIRVLLQIVFLDIKSFDKEHPVVKLFELSKIKYLTSVYEKHKSEVDNYVDQVLDKINNLKEGEKFLLSNSEWIIGSHKSKNSLNIFSKNNSEFYSKRELCNKIKLQHLSNIQPIPNSLLLEMDDVVK